MAVMVLYYIPVEMTAPDSLAMMCSSFRISSPVELEMEDVSIDDAMDAGAKVIQFYPNFVLPYFLG